MGLAAIQEKTEIIKREFGNINEENNVEELSARVEHFKKYVEERVKLGEEAVNGFREFLEGAQESVFIKYKEILKDLIEHLRRTVEVIRVQSNRFKSSRSSLLSAGVFADLATRVESLAEDLDDVADNMDLLIRYHNKEDGNNLQVAYDRLEDPNDPFISNDEMRKLLEVDDDTPRSPVKTSVNVEATYIVGGKIKPLPLDDELVYFDE